MCSFWVQAANTSSRGAAHTGESTISPSRGQVSGGKFAFMTSTPNEPFGELTYRLTKAENEVCQGRVSRASPRLRRRRLRHAACRDSERSHQRPSPPHPRREGAHRALR